jgi:hypothetical protein
MPGTPTAVADHNRCQPVRYPDFPKIPLFSWDPEQRKAPAGMAATPYPQVVHLQTQSRELDKIMQQYGHRIERVVSAKGGRYSSLACSQRL